MLKKDIKEYLNKWRYISDQRLSIVKMSILHKLTNRFNAILSKLQQVVFILFCFAFAVGKIVLKFIWNSKELE